MTKPILVIYHANCADGMAAMMAAKVRFGEGADYFACNYNEYKLVMETTDNSRLRLDYKDKSTILSGRSEIYVVDFSFRRAELQAIGMVSETVVVLDHHKTAQAELMLQTEVGWRIHPDLPSNVVVHFAMNKAGCWLTWEELNGHLEMPDLLHLVGLRDLWEHKGNPSTQEKCEALQIYIQTVGFQNEEEWSKMLVDEYLYTTAIAKGKGIKQFFDQKVNEACGFARAVDFKHLVEGHLFMGVRKVVNAPHYMASEIGDRLKSTCDYSVIWSYTKDGKVICSMRSSAPFDVSAIAKKYGGGGHAQAAGCSFDTFEAFSAVFLGGAK